MKKLFFLIIFLLGFSLFSGTVFAYYSPTVVYQAVGDTLDTISTGEYRVQGIASSTISGTLADQVWQITLKITSISNIVELGFWHTYPTAFCDAAFNAAGEKQYGNAISVTKDGDYYTMECPQIDPSSDVFLKLKGEGGSVEIWGTDTENYPEGSFFLGADDPWKYSYEQGVLEDVFFIMSTTGGIEPSVSITRPEDSGTTYSTDPIVVGKYDFSDKETEGLLNLEVRLGGTTTTIIEQQKLLPEASSTFSLWLNNSYYLASETVRTQATTTVDMYVDLWDTAETELHAQASSTFTVHNQFFIIEGIGTTTDIFFVDCSMYGEAGFFSSTTISRIGCEGKKIIYDFAGFMILPQEWASNLFGGSFEALKSKFPFSVVYSLTSAVGSGAETASGSTSTAPLILTFPENTPLTLEVLSTSTLDGAGAIKDIVFEGIEYILWAILGVMVIKLII